MKLLVVEAIANIETSNTKKLSDEFIKEYKILHPGAEIKVMNLYDEDIDFLRKETLEKMFSNQDNVALNYVRDLKKYDNILFAFPFWNLSYPAILKAYLDYIVYNGETFHYTENGPAGHLTNTKFAYIVSRGGVYDQTPQLKHGALHLIDTMSFIGAKIVGEVEFEGTSMYPQATTDENRNKLIPQVKELAAKF